MLFTGLACAQFDARPIVPEKTGNTHSTMSRRLTQTQQDRHQTVDTPPPECNTLSPLQKSCSCHSDISNITYHTSYDKIYKENALKKVKEGTVIYHNTTIGRQAASSLGVHHRRVWVEQGGVAGHLQADPLAAGGPDRALLAAWPGAVVWPLQQLAEGVGASLLVPLDPLDSTHKKYSAKG